MTSAVVIYNIVIQQLNFKPFAYYTTSHRGSYITLNIAGNFQANPAISQTEDTSDVFCDITCYAQQVEVFYLKVLYHNTRRVFYTTDPRFQMPVAPSQADLEHERAEAARLLWLPTSQ